MLTPKYIEEGRALEKAARRVINYRKDIARPEDLAAAPGKGRRVAEGLEEAFD